MSQWDRSVSSTPNGRRTIMVTARVNGLFTHGHAGGGPARAALQDRAYGLQERIPVRMAHRPYRDAEYVPAGKVSKTAVCPGCGIVPPRGMQCDQCWG